ncbi:MAG: ATP-binding protein [Nitrososphaerales archaeon]
MQEKFDAKAFIDEAIRKLKQEIGGEAVAACSGGVDSTVTAVLGYRALGEGLTAVFLDDGLMREGEPESVASMLSKLGLKVKVYDVSEEFFKALKGITDPELKRKTFRSTFYHTLSRVVKELGAKYLLQGTIAADIVETSRGVKTQHNVLEQIGIDAEREYGYKVVEPLKTLYKHQVRLVAEALKLPKEVIERRPFPGPGLSIRVLGEVTRERVELVRRATKIIEEETKGIRCFQAFAVLMSDRATGVTEDGKRRYGEVVVVRAVDSLDAMAAKSTEIAWSVLERISSRITDELPTVTRVLYELTGKPPATIEFE